MKLIIQDSNINYDAKNKSFLGNGKRIPFATSYTLKNKDTNGEMTFDFKESTGSEWDPKTLWIYESKTGYKFILTNEDVTPAHANAYLTAKLSK